MISSQEIITSPHADADIKSPDRLSANTVLQDSSLAEGAAGLLAMTSTADRAKGVQVNPSLFSCLLPVIADSKTFDADRQAGSHLLVLQ